jgi:2-polyprenyl-6-methoxyphenol hydroxylase-like FAD-dependent oxidoreductase
MKIVCIGGGPAGLYFGTADEDAQPGARHHGGRAQQALRHLRLGRGVFRRHHGQHAPVGSGDRAEIQQAFNHWDDIELEFKGEVIRSGGHGFVGIGRKKLLNILQARCEQLGVNLVFDTDVESDEDFPDADLIIASDGINSKIRTKYETVFKPDIVVRPTVTSGWARTSSTTRSPSCSRRPSTAGSRRISTSSTRPPPPSSSNAPSTSGRRTDWIWRTRPSPSPSAKSCLRRTCRAPR